jgi:hypothetical protein
MASPSLAILKKNLRNNPVLLEVVATLQIARRQWRQLAGVTPGGHFAIDRRIHQIVASLVRLASDTSRAQ